MKAPPVHDLQWLHHGAARPAYLYHYVRWGWFRRWLADKTVTLSNPLRWDDPTEWLWTNWIQQHIAASVLCMCWTRSQRSEANWTFDRGKQSAWSDADKAMVRVRTTLDRLSRAIAGSEQLRDEFPGKSFLVPITYVPDRALERRFFGLANCKPVAREAALALSYKRYPYRHEKEVRWVHVIEGKKPVLAHQPIRIDLDTLVDQLMIDPRASVDIAQQIRAEVRDYGFANDVARSRLFELPRRLQPFAVRPRE